MLSKETLDAYRRMTPGERLAITFEMIRESTPSVVERRFALLQRENDLRNERLLAALRRLPPLVAGRT
jgi:hypothetical protein